MLMNYNHVYKGIYIFFKIHSAFTMESNRFLHKQWSCYFSTLVKHLISAIKTQHFSVLFPFSAYLDLTLDVTLGLLFEECNEIKGFPDAKQLKQVDQTSGKQHRQDHSSHGTKAFPASWLGEMLSL